MKSKREKSELSKLLWNLSVEKFATTQRADYRFAPINALILVGVFVVGLIVHLNVHPFSVRAVGLAIGSALVLAVFLRVCQMWEAAIVLGTADCLAIYLMLRPESDVLLATAAIALIVAPSIQIAYQWERAVLLRFGKFRGLRKSGLFVIFPVIDKVAQFVDQRIRVSDFSAETTLTADTVPVNVDAISFWMVWDAEKAVLEVEHFDQAVVLSAQTALRNAIGRHDLAELLSERDKLGQEIQKVLDEKTSAWGITTQAVEIRDIIIPKALEDAMSRQAQAERERQSRIILGTAETEIAEKFARASIQYKNNPVALHLRAMNMVYEGLRQKGSMIIVPSSAVETMGLGALGGLTAFGQAAAQGAAENDAPPIDVEASSDVEPGDDLADGGVEGGTS
jgi:regulator of protease activity HflC (stomatin/prohibitin superfamily)